MASNDPTPRAHLYLGPLVDPTNLIALGAPSEIGTSLLYHCGCALKLDLGEGAYRYHIRCLTHSPYAQSAT